MNKRRTFAAALFTLSAGAEADRAHKSKTQPIQRSFLDSCNFSQDHGIRKETTDMRVLKCAAQPAGKKRG